MKEGDAIFAPPQADHYTLNSSHYGKLHRIEVNPIVASQGISTSNQAGNGTGRTPVNSNYRNLTPPNGARILGSHDGVPNYAMPYNGRLQVLFHTLTQAGTSTSGNT